MPKNRLCAFDPEFDVPSSSAFFLVYSILHFLGHVQGSSQDPMDSLSAAQGQKKKKKGETQNKGGGGKRESKARCL